MTHTLVPSHVHTHVHQHTHTHFLLVPKKVDKLIFKTILSFKSAQAALSLGTSAAVRGSRPGPAGWGVWCSRAWVGSPAPPRAVCVFSVKPLRLSGLRVLLSESGGVVVPGSQGFGRVGCVNTCDAPRIGPGTYREKKLCVSCYYLTKPSLGKPLASFLLGFFPVSSQFLVLPA